MTRVFEKPRAGGGTRLLVLGASAYPHAKSSTPRVPKLNPISSAATSATEFAFCAISRWKEQFARPLASVDLLVDVPDAPDGASFTSPDGTVFKLDPPTMAKVKEARKSWMKQASAEDALVFYC